MIKVFCNVCDERLDISTERDRTLKIGGTTVTVTVSPASGLTLQSREDYCMSCIADAISEELKKPKTNVADQL